MASGIDSKPPCEKMANIDDNRKLTDETYWDNFWSSVKLPIIAKPPKTIRLLLAKYIPKDTNLTFFEIGCAPGGWMVFFNKEFGFNVSGIEYAKGASDLTKKNLEFYELPQNVTFGDFFEHESPQLYDIVFTRGFIEHFEDNEFVVNRIVGMSRKYVITVIPNLFGIGGLVSKIFRPDVYKKHVLISLKQLKKIHESQGLDILYCSYSPEFQLPIPFEKNHFSKKYPILSKVLNFPIKISNRILNFAIERIKWCPGTRLFSPSLVCIAEKK